MRHPWQIYTKAVKNISISIDRWKKWLVPYIVIVSVTSIIYPLHIKTKIIIKKQTNKTTYKLIHVEWKEKLILETIEQQHFLLTH